MAWVDKNGKATEHAEAVAFIQWCETHKFLPTARKIIKIKNEIKVPRREIYGNPQHGKALAGYAFALIMTERKEGVRPGVSDYFSPVARGPYHGLFIELKKEKGTPSGAQKRWARWCMEEGYLAVFAYGWQQAAAIVEKYDALGPYTGKMPDASGPDTAT